MGDHPHDLPSARVEAWEKEEGLFEASLSQLRELNDLKVRS